MKFIYSFFIIALIVSLSSCRKDKQFVIKKTEIISKQEIDSLKNIERKLLIWRSKKNFTTLKKYLNARESYLKFSKKKLSDRMFLSEFYFYLSFITKNKENKIYALKKGIDNSKWILKTTSKKYKESTDKYMQDYKIIQFVNKNEVTALYWYITNTIFLRKETQNIVLYKEDLDKSLKYYYQISENKEKIFAEAIYLASLPKIGGKDKETSKKILETLNDSSPLNIIIKNLFLKDYKKHSLDELKLNNNNLKEQIFNKINKDIIKTKK